MSFLPHCQVGGKQEASDIRDGIIVEFPTHVIIYVLKSKCDKTLENPKRSGCTVRQMKTLHILQYSYSLMTGSATAYYCINYINFNTVDGWKQFTKVMTVSTKFAQK